MHARELPARPKLEHYKKLAKDFLKAYKSGDSASMERMKGQRGIGIQSAKFVLADAQLLIAREHGFESWPKFKRHIEAILRKSSDVSKFESAADAVVTGDVATLKRLLRENPELIQMRSTRAHQSTLLHYVSANGVEDFRQKTPRNAVAVAKILLQAGAEVDAVSDAYGKSSTLGLVATSVHPARAGVQIALIETLLEAGAAADGPPGERSSPLAAALANGRGNAAEFLAERGARLDLEGAAGVGRLDVVKGFFNDDGSVKANATKAQMESGFAWACEYGRTSVVDFLLQKGLKVDARLKPDGRTGLHWAAYYAHVDTVKLLLEKKAPVSAKDKSYDATPLGWALHAWGDPPPEANRDRYYQVVALLVGAGATVDPAWLGDGDSRMLAALGGSKAIPEGELPLRIVLEKPPAGVDFGLQKGHGSGYETIQTQRSTTKNLNFEFTVRVKPGARNAQTVFLGPLVQGPLSERFVYIDIGTAAGQTASCWSRRLKIPLSGITRDMIDRLPDGAVLEARVPGTGKDGGPTCGLVRNFGGWKVARSRRD